MQEQINIYTQNKLQRASSELDQLAQTLSLLSIENTLKRGFTMTYDAKGKLIVDADSLKKGDIVETQFYKGKQKSKIQ